MSSEITEIIKRYLLGEATRKEQTFVEEFLKDEDFYEEYWITEDELVSDYLSNELKHRERKLFEKNYLSSDKHKEKLALKTLILSSMVNISLPQADFVSPKIRSASASNSIWLRGLILKPVTLFIIIFSLLVSLITLLINNRSLETTLKQKQDELNAEQNHIEQILQKNETLQQEFERQKKNNEELANQVENERKEHEAQSSEFLSRLERIENSQVEKKPQIIQSQLNSIVNLQPLRGIMGAGSNVSANELVFTRKTFRVTINLILPKYTPTYDAFRAEIKDKNGSASLEFSGLKARGRIVTLRISPSKLSVGEKIISLQGINESDEPRDAGFYNVQIVKK